MDIVAEHPADMRGVLLCDIVEICVFHIIFTG